jgi:hypothetical protein
MKNGGMPGADPASAAAGAAAASSDESEGENSNKKDDDIVDADFEVVDDEEKEAK